MPAIDINKVYNSIVEKLKGSNNGEVILELGKSSAGAATGSEALMMQASYMLSLKKLHPGVFKIIEDEIGSYLNYCHNHGLYPK